MKIVSNCPLCEEKSLHILGEGELQTQQCINCGYVTAEKFKLNDGKLEDNEHYKQLTEDMRKWVKVENDRLWLPTMMALPIGMLYPFNDKDNNMKWAFAKMITIPEDDRKNYPNPEGGFYEKRVDTENAKQYDTFLEGISELNQKMKEDASKSTEIKLPKLKKIDTTDGK